MAVMEIPALCRHTLEHVHFSNSEAILGIVKVGDLKGATIHSEVSTLSLANDMFWSGEWQGIGHSGDQLLSAGVLPSLLFDVSSSARCSCKHYLQMVIFIPDWRSLLCLNGLSAWPSRLSQQLIAGRRAKRRDKYFFKILTLKWLTGALMQRSP